jgi:uncharacterized protein YxeA
MKKVLGVILGVALIVGVISFAAYDPGTGGHSAAVKDPGTGGHVRVAYDPGTGGH